MNQGLSGCLVYISTFLVQCLIPLLLKRKNKGNAFVGYTPLESIKTLSFATITNVIGSAVN